MIYIIAKWTFLKGLVQDFDQKCENVFFFFSGKNAYKRCLVMFYVENNPF